MKPLGVLVVGWAFAGAGAMLGSILGNAAGRAGLFSGAIVGGLIGVTIATFVLTRLKWLPADYRRGALLGGLIGFLIAAPIAVTNLHTPITPLLVSSLAGAGLLVGAGATRGWRRGP